MTRWTYSRINIRTVLGRIRSLLLVRPYQVNNQVKLLPKPLVATAHLKSAMVMATEAIPVAPPD